MVQSLHSNSKLGGCKNHKKLHKQKQNKNSSFAGLANVLESSFWSAAPVPRSLLQCWVVYVYLSVSTESGLAYLFVCLFILKSSTTARTCSIRNLVADWATEENKLFGAIKIVIRFFFYLFSFILPLPLPFVWTLFHRQSMLFLSFVYLYILLSSRSRLIKINNNCSIVRATRIKLNKDA